MVETSEIDHKDPIVILGAKGMLGNEMRNILKDAISFGREEFDLTKDIDRLYDLKPSMIINCAAYNNVDKAEEDDTAFDVNARAIRRISEYCKENSCILMHFSTNYVFDGTREEGYSKEDMPNPINRYGMSKLEGERYVQELDKYFLIRTALVFGGERKNIVRTLYTLLKENKPLKLVNNLTNITYAKDLAKASLNLLKHNKYGLHHITNSGALSIAELGKYIKDKINSDSIIEIIEDEGRSAKRPKYSTLKNTVKLRHWKEAVDEYIAFLEAETIE